MTSQTITCLHSNSLHDAHSGDILCTECGLVIDREYVIDVGLEPLGTIESKLSSSINRYLCCMNLPNTYCNEIEKIIQTKFSCYKYCEEVKIIAALYLVLVNHSISFSLKYILHKFLRSQKHVRQCTFLVSTQPNFNQFQNDVSMIASSILENLGYSYFDIKSIKRLISEHKCENCSYSPITLVVANTYLYFKANNSPKSLLDLCNFTGITRNSVYNYLNAKKHICVNKWS